MSVIVRPLSRREVVEGLTNGKYNDMGGLVEDLRLMYYNALVFNGGVKGPATPAASERSTPALPSARCAASSSSYRRRSSPSRAP